jgi:hypothetical protein
MATTPTYINQRINNLQAQINSIISGGGGGVPTSSDLADVLVNGNSAGTSDIDMNFNDITNVNEVVLSDNVSLTNTLTPSSILIADSTPLTTTLTATSGSVVINNPNLNVSTQQNSLQFIVVDNGTGEQVNLGLQSLQFLNASAPTTISNTNGQDLSITSTGGLNLTAPNGVFLTSNLSVTDANVTVFDSVNGVQNTVVSGGMNVFNVFSGEQINLDFGGLVFGSSTVPTTISNGGGQDLSITADGVLQLGSVVANIANFNTYNINNFGYAMPICFTRERADNFTYNFGGQVWENVYTTSVNVPSQLFTDSSVSYTSSYWKIDFALNCYLNSSTGDKGLAMYIEFEDQSSTPYLPNVYNLNTPYAVYQTASTFTNSPQQPFQNFNWSDIIDFSPLTASGSGNVPLNMKLWIAGDNSFTCNFSMVMTLTRTNLV